MHDQELALGAHQVHVHVGIVDKRSEVLRLGDVRRIQTHVVQAEPQDWLSFLNGVANLILETTRDELHLIAEGALVHVAGRVQQVMILQIVVERSIGGAGRLARLLLEQRRIRLVHELVGVAVHEARAALVDVGLHQMLVVAVLRLLHHSAPDEDLVRATLALLGDVVLVLVGGDG